MSWPAVGYGMLLRFNLKRKNSGCLAICETDVSGTWRNCAVAVILFLHWSNRKGAVDYVELRLKSSKFMKTKEVTISLPFGIGSIKLVPTEAEKNAAWTLFVEVSTRVSVRPFDYENASVRIALDSLYRIILLTREVLSKAGHEVADGPGSLGPLAISVINNGLAPFLTCWHNRLRKHEEGREEGVTAFEHERRWEYFQEVVQEIEVLQRDLVKYTIALGQIAGINQGIMLGEPDHLSILGISKEPKLLD